jgi:hypothetical protein
MHVVLAIQEQFHRELLLERLTDECDVRVMEETGGEFAVAAVLRTLLVREPFNCDDPVIVIASDDEVPEKTSVTTRLLSEFPEVLFVSIDWRKRRICSHQASISVRDLSGSLDSLIEELRAASSTTSRRECPPVQPRN